jgi:cell division protein FtsW
MEIFKPYGFDKALFFTALALITIGLVMVFSASAFLSHEKYHSLFHFFINQLTGAFVGIVLILSMIPIRKAFYQNFYFIHGLLLISFILLVLCLLMPPLAKTNRWVQFMGFRFQPSELAKLSLVLFFSYHLDRKKEKLNEYQTFLFPLAVLFLFLILIIKEPDYGTALLVCIICLSLLFIAGVKLKYFFYMGIFSSGLFVFYLFQASYRLNRILAFFDPERDSQGIGFQIIQSKMAVGSGGLIGVSIGESIQKLFFLPCAHTDYIYAIVGEELGLIGTLAILLLFLIFFWRGLHISRTAPNFFAQIAAIGLTLTIFFQALLNISVVIGLGPSTGIPLPLISFGRSSLLCSCFYIGILLNISQRKANMPRTQ